MHVLNILYYKFVVNPHISTGFDFLSQEVPVNNVEQLHINKILSHILRTYTNLLTSSWQYQCPMEIGMLSMMVLTRGMYIHHSISTEISQGLLVKIR